MGGIVAERDYEKWMNDPLPFLERLILNGVQEKNIKNWYLERPKNITIEWIEENIDSLIIKHVLIPDKVDFLPDHLKKKGYFHAWKFIILPDLVNKSEQYFGTYRDNFPFSEYEKSYFTEDDDYSSFFSGVA